MSRPVSPADLTALKTATFDLIRACDGVERAATVAGIGKSTMQRAYAARDERNPEEMSAATLDLVSVLLLERDLADRGDPRRPVTECLARLTGRAVTDPGAQAAKVSLGEATAQAMAAVGTFAASLAPTLAAGRQPTPAEGRAARAELARMMAAVSAIDGRLSSVIAGEDEA